MIQFKHYHKLSLIGSGRYRFRQYSQYLPIVGDERFAQFIEGTLEELGPEDFGDLTAVPEYSLVGLFNTRVVLPDSITELTTNVFGFSEGAPKETVFPSNFASIPHSLFVSIASSEAVGKVFNFEKATKVVPMTGYESMELTSGTLGPTIKVPASLYNQWIKAAGWSQGGIAQYIVAV